MANAILAIHSVIVASGGTAETFRLGDFLNYGNADILARIRHEAKTPGGYSGVMTELIFAGWCLANKISVTASSRPRTADFIVQGLDGADECCVECKSLEIFPSIAKRVNSRLSEANAQIKETSDNLPGIALLRLNNVWRNSFSDLDKQPAEVKDSVFTANRALSSHLRSVSAAAILWDEFNLKDSKERPEITYAILRRHSLWVSHHEPKLAFPNVSKFRELGAWLIFEIPKTLRTEKVKTSALWRFV